MTCFLKQIDSIVLTMLQSCWMLCRVLLAVIESGDWGKDRIFWNRSVYEKPPAFIHNISASLVNTVTKLCVANLQAVQDAHKVL